MPLLTKQYRFAQITPQEMWSRITTSSNLFLPSSLKKVSFNHYRESTGTHFGFQIHQPWAALPAGDWKVLGEQVEWLPAEKVTYRLNVASENGKIYSGILTIAFAKIDVDTQVTLIVDGVREVELAPYSDDLIATLIRSLIRESWTNLEQLLDFEDAASPDENRDHFQHMNPLAVAVGIFSAGMALGLWLWRRKHKDRAA